MFWVFDGLLTCVSHSLWSRHYYLHFIDEGEAKRDSGTAKMALRKVSEGVIPLHIVHILAIFAVYALHLLSHASALPHALSLESHPIYPPPPPKTGII